MEDYAKSILKLLIYKRFEEMQLKINSQCDRITLLIKNRKDFFMKRKIFAYLCLAVMAVSLIGCGSKSASSDTKKESTTTEDETTTDKKSSDEDETTTDKKSSDEDETTTDKKSSDEDETTTGKKSSDEDETTTDKNSSGEDRDVDTTDWTEYKGTGYSISAPKIWLKHEYEASDLTLANSVTSTDGFAENITVISQDVSAYDFDLEGYKDLSLNQYEYLNYTVISTEKMTVNGVDGYYLVCTTETDGTLCYCTQYFTLIDDTAYIFTFAADTNGYQELSEEVKDIFSTIKFD